ncbi:unnamed protein product, partial [Porites evermanni]
QQSLSPLINDLFSIDWAHNLTGLPKISDHPLVSSVINAAQRLLRRPRVKKDPVTPEMLRALVESKIKDKSPENSCLVSYWLSRIFFNRRRLTNFVTGVGFLSLRQANSLSFAQWRPWNDILRRPTFLYKTKEFFMDAFRYLTDVSNIGTHSLRAGGATAADNASIQDRLFKRHGL